MPQARDEAGNVWETDAQGNAVRLISAAGGEGITALTPPDPNKELDAIVKRATLANMAADNARADRAENKPPSGYRWSASGQLEPIPGGPNDPAVLSAATKPALTAKERADAIAGYKSATSLDRIIAQLEAQYKAGPGATSGVAGLQDYLPTTANRQFDSTGNAARGIVGQALGFTGGQLNTATEAEAAVGPYLPKAGDRDAVILDKIQRLRDLANDARVRSTAILGGVPDENGRVQPVATQRDETMPALFNGGGGSITNGPAGPAAPSGSTTKAMDIPPAMQAELNQYLAAVPRGQLDEAQFKGVLSQLNAKYGVGSGAQDVSGWVKFYNEQRGPINATLTGPEVPMSTVDQLRNNAVNNPLGGAAAGYLNMAGFGVPQALAPDKIDAISDAQSIPYALGQVGGALTGTSLVAGAGRNTLGRIAPRSITGGGRLGIFGRGAATDATYGAGYGQIAEGDPLTGAAAASAGSVLGQGAAGALSRVGRGITASPAVEALRSRGIPLTAGQTLGGTWKGIEDRLAGLPVVGDLVNARRMEGLKAFNEAAIGDVAGGQIVPTGPQAIDNLRPVVSGMYDRATAGVTVPTSPQLTADLAAAQAAGGALPPDLAQRFSTAMQNRVNPVVDAGQMTGDQFQQMQRALKGYRAEAPKAGFEQDYRDALGMVSSALDANMRNQGGASVMQGLDEANAAYRKLKVIEDAVTRARNGRSGETGIFTPAQLNDASVSSARKFGGNQATTARPFYDLGEAGQSVLPSSVPDSGTVGRWATLALPSAFGGTGAGVDYLTGGDKGLETGLLLGAALTAGGTKAGQKALITVLRERPESVRRAANAIGRRKGMFGSAAVPLVIEQSRP